MVTIMNTVCKLLPDYLRRYGERFRIESIGYIANSCPSKTKKIRTVGARTYFATTCAKATDMRIKVSLFGVLII